MFALVCQHFSLLACIRGRNSWITEDSVGVAMQRLLSAASGSGDPHLSLPGRQDDSPKNKGASAATTEVHKPGADCW